MIKALTAQLQEQTAAYTARWSGSNANSQQDMDKRYAWKRVPPKSGEPSTKKMRSDGKDKIYHWCPHHNQWTIHTAACELSLDPEVAILFGREIGQSNGDVLLTDC